METYLEIQDAHVHYGEHEVLRGIDLAVGKGEFVALLGSSGCGKTTLLRTIAGFNAPSRGKVLVGGKDITQQPPDRRGMALVFQSYALWPHMTIAQNIGYGLKLRGHSRQAIRGKVSQIESMMGLDGLGQRKPAALSGGQRQRVALGRALAVDPDILLLDEPLSNLDARIRLTLRHEISALQHRLGITAIHVTHDREEAMVMADRIVILENGKIAQLGTPQSVYNHPCSNFVAAFMGAENKVDVEITLTGQQVHIAAGPHHAAAIIRHDGQALADGHAIVRFRNESVQLLADTPSVDLGASGALILQGSVVQASYPGGVWRHMVSLGDHTVIVDADQKFQTDTPVLLRIPENHLYIFNQS
ncbi:ABC transporter ATP-binding protein [Castellaniella sp.]|uniref:ABC transporter ATP-binding protein n=1 Tax=Castellaniella sp. TaxID=1955812 RepID=UPI002AFEAA3D|nr:ABC transporter ATP-binding protein [Castellaniella sp.]